MELTPEQIKYREWLYRLHTSGGGSLSWEQIAQQEGMTSKHQPRGMVRRWLQKHPWEHSFQFLKGALDEPYIPPFKPEFCTRLAAELLSERHIEDMLEKLVGKRDTEEDAESEDNPF